MKFLKYLSIAAAVLSLASCQKDDKTQALPAGEVTAPVLGEHAAIIVEPSSLKNEVSFSWSAVDYGYPAAVAYGLYAVYGEGEPVQVGEAYATSYTTTKEALNNILVNPKGLAVPEDRTSTVQFFVKSAISQEREDYIFSSNVISVEITTIKSTAAAWVRRPLYVAGDHQNWSPDKAPVLWETSEFSDVYEGLVLLLNPADPTAQAHFKFCPNPNWTGNLGGDPNGLTNEGDPAHVLADPGMYWITVTLNTAHTTGKVELTSITSVGVIGAAIGGWAPFPDLELTLAGLPTPPADLTDAAYKDAHYAAVNAQVWEGVCDAAAGGEFVFRLNNTYDMKYGGDLAHLVKGGGNVATDLSGRLTFSINFKGDIPKLAEDSTNPSPISGSVTKVEAE